MAAKITGNFILDGNEFRFTAIAFGRIGGQNVGAKLSKATIKELKHLGYDTDEVIITITISFYVSIYFMRSIFFNHASPEINRFYCTVCIFPIRKNSL